MDASFLVYPDFKSHTEAIVTLGQGEMHSVSNKQNLNTRISTEDEVFAVDDPSGHIIWAVLFIEWEG